MSFSEKAWELAGAGAIVAGSIGVGVPVAAWAIDYMEGYQPGTAGHQKTILEENQRFLAHQEAGHKIITDTLGAACLDSLKPYRITILPGEAEPVPLEVMLDDDPCPNGRLRAFDEILEWDKSVINTRVQVDNAEAAYEEAHADQQADRSFSGFESTLKIAGPLGILAGLAVQIGVAIDRRNG